jgi:protein ImuA
MPHPQSSLINELSERIRTLETSHRSHWRRSLALGVDGLQTVLPEGRLPGGSLLEFLVADAGCGGWTLALALARSVCAGGRGLVIVDSDGSWYPPAVWSWGIDLGHTLWARSGKDSTSLAILTQSLRSPAVGAGIGWFDRIMPKDFRRLQLAAEKGGGLGLLLRPVSAAATTSFAAARLVVYPTASRNGRRRLLLEPLKVLSPKPLVLSSVHLGLSTKDLGPSPSSLLLEIDDETHRVCVLSRLASAMSEERRIQSVG